MKKLLCFLTAATLLLSAVPVSLAENTEANAKVNLVSQITDAAVSYIATDDADYYMYKDMNWSSIADTLPAKFDLRDRGVVPEVRNQGNWGTCWAFASIAAVETSVLSSLGITAEQYAGITGSSFDLSEKHLAWFGSSHLPTLDRYAEGEYPYPESQAGEGEWHNNEDTDPNMAHYFSGGFVGYSAGIFANGNGPVMEEAYPYTANDGSSSTTADWSIDESARFQTAAELKSSNILPSPSQRDADGNYYYNAAGTEAIKKELLAGRGVSIVYHADQAMSPEAQLNMSIDSFAASLGLDREAARLFICVGLGMLDPYEFTQEERVLFMKAAVYSGLEEGYSADSTQEELEALTAAKFDTYAAKARAKAEQQSAGQQPTEEQPAADPAAEEMPLDEKLEASIAEAMAAGLDRETAEIAASVSLGIVDPYSLNRDERVLLIKALLMMQGMSEDSITQEILDQCVDTAYNQIIVTALGIEPPTEEASAEQDADTTALREAAAKLGKDYDAYMASAAKMQEASQVQYINTDTYAQCNDNQYAIPTHAVTIIGWDDDYAVENFLADHQPPAPGAWIVRNSWGESYGNAGYFYLSYYDQTIICPETVEYVFDTNAIEGGIKIESYDMMQASAVSSAHMETPVYSANIFPVDDESVLAYVSVMTADLNAKTTVAVYLLNENYTSPVDGVLLETVTADFEFGGYHRIALNNTYQLPAGSVISVVQKQAAVTTDGLRYTLPFTNAMSEEAVQCQEAMSPSGLPTLSWFVGCIGKGESFINVDNTWYDWKDVVNEVRGNNSIAALMEFDNMNIKAYFYTVDGVNAAHKYGPAQQTLGAEALICEECGETLIVVK